MGLTSLNLKLSKFRGLKSTLKKINKIRTFLSNIPLGRHFNINAMIHTNLQSSFWRPKAKEENEVRNKPHILFFFFFTNRCTGPTTNQSYMPYTNKRQPFDIIINGH